MKTEERDINKNSGAILFVILISLFLFIFDCESNDSDSGSAYYTVQPDLTRGYYSSHAESFIFDIPHFPVVVKDCGYSLYSPDLYSFNLNFKILDFNRRIVQNIISVQKTRLSIEPSSFWKYYFHPASKEKEELPVLS